MLRLTIITLTIVGLLLYVGFYGYNKLLSVSLAGNARNFSATTGPSTKSTVMTLSDCNPGYIPFFPSFQGKILVSPHVIEVTPNEEVKIINGDSTPHTIGLVNSKVWEAIEPGDSFKIDTTMLPQTGRWFLTCDGINMGDQSPVIQFPGI